MKKLMLQILLVIAILLGILFTSPALGIQTFEKPQISQGGYGYGYGR